MEVIEPLHMFVYYKCLKKFQSSLEIASYILVLHTEITLAPVYRAIPFFLGSPIIIPAACEMWIAPLVTRKMHVLC
jgi:hypothetical protein